MITGFMTALICLFLQKIDVEMFLSVSTCFPSIQPVALGPFWSLAGGPHRPGTAVFKDRTDILYKMGFIPACPLDLRIFVAA